MVGDTYRGRCTLRVSGGEAFHNLHKVNEVALERAAGRGWMFRVGETWYANRSEKQELKQLWEI